MIDRVSTNVGRGPLIGRLNTPPAAKSTFRFYAVPAVIVTFCVGPALVALRSGVFVDDRGLVVKPYVGVRSQRIPLDTIRAITVTAQAGAVFAWVSPAVLPMSGVSVVLGLAHYDSSSRWLARARASVGDGLDERIFSGGIDD